MPELAILHFPAFSKNLQVDFNAQILISQNGHTIYEYTPATEEFQASLSPMEKQTLLHTDGIVELTKKYYVRHVDNHSSGWKITCIVPYTPFLLERLKFQPYDRYHRCHLFSDRRLADVYLQQWNDTHAAQAQEIRRSAT